MKRIVVNDASCLIDLSKGGLLAAFCKLPYRLVVPLPVRELEVRSFNEDQWRLLDQAGMITRDLSPREIGQAIEIREQHPGLSENDCFCLVTMDSFPGILPTGDALMRRVAETKGLRVHGMLWVVDELDASECCTGSLLTNALKAWRDDKANFLPRDEIGKRLDYFARSTHNGGSGPPRPP